MSSAARACAAPSASSPNRLAVRGRSWFSRNHAGQARSDASASKSSIETRNASASQSSSAKTKLREVQLVAAVEEAHDPVQVVQRDLADDHPVVVLVDDAADRAQPVVHRLPVLVVPPCRARVRA